MSFESFNKKCSVDTCRMYFEGSHQGPELCRYCEAKRANAPHFTQAELDRVRAETFAQTRDLCAQIVATENGMAAGYLCDEIRALTLADLETKR